MHCKFLVRKRFLFWYHPAFSLCRHYVNIFCIERGQLFVWYCPLKHVPMYFYWNAVHLQCISHWFVLTELSCHVNNRLLDNFRPPVMLWFFPDGDPRMERWAARTWFSWFPFGLFSLIFKNDGTLFRGRTW